MAREKAGTIFVNQRKLNTKGCCFLCLKIVDFKSDNLDSKGTVRDTRTIKQSVSLKLLQKYLKISPSGNSYLRKQQSATDGQVTSKGKNKNNNAKSGNSGFEDIIADLCEDCAKITNNVSRLCLSLEKIHMEINYWLAGIHQQISEAVKQPELFQNYSKRMTREADSLAQLVFVDNIRKEIAKKSSNQGTRSIRIVLQPIRLARVSKFSVNTIVTNQAEECLPPQIKSEPVIVEEDKNDEPQIDYVIESVKEETIFETNNDDMPPLNQSILPSKQEQHNDIKSAIEPSSECSVPTIGNVFSLSRMCFKTDSGQFQCTSCTKVLTSRGGARRHFKSVHLLKRYNCDLCGATYADVCVLKAHRKKCNGNKPTTAAPPGTKSKFNSETGRYNCTWCNKEFFNQPTTWMHYQKVHLQKKFKCDICNISVLSSKLALSQHKERCRDTLKSRLALVKERKTNPKFKFACKTCGKRFVEEKQMLKHHKLVHLNVRRHSCNLCTKSFKQSTHLTRHKLAVHLGRRWECQLCKKLFNFKDNYLQHKRKCREKIKTELETHEKCPTKK